MLLSSYLTSFVAFLPRAIGTSLLSTRTFAFFPWDIHVQHITFVADQMNRIE